MVVSQEEKLRKKLHRDQELTNPCLKEQEISFKCLSDYDYNPDACIMQFENYKACKRFWGSIVRQRRWKGIKPDLPPLEERAKIKEEYMQRKHS